MIMLCGFGLLHTILHHTFIEKDMLSVIEAASQEAFFYRAVCDGFKRTTDRNWA